ncbi:hypothetical protein [Leptolyngbya sp. FACHB-261]|uniref:hypothetical protein n=1 Tax=Leptolyngbya sp. FACHB-261 TaxID=2692806 RepID=UPI00168A33F4|nr:hypothetical protein [Leptolyngbya sp. FACHB-261]MBD2100826.1 hypothetical protein [Leptolyngbya sp. FACHB-261]
MSQTSPDSRVPRPPRPPETRPVRPNTDTQDRVSPEQPLSEGEQAGGTSDSSSSGLSPRPPLARPIRPSVVPTADPEPAPAPSASSQTEPDAPPEEELEGLQRNQPIPPPSEPTQYRAIGVIRGRYVASSEQFTRGDLIAADGTVINAVLLGRVMSLVKNHLELDREYLWVVYPRTRDKTHQLHAQILGVWEPVELGKAEEPLDPGIEDGYFSVRGEVIFQSQDRGYVIVKIRQAPRKGAKEKPKSFKLRLAGFLPSKGVGYFWSLEVQRDGEQLMIQDGQSIAPMPPRKKRGEIGPSRGGPPRRSAGVGRGEGGGGLRRDNVVRPAVNPQRSGPVTKPIKRSDRPRREGEG